MGTAGSCVHVSAEEEKKLRKCFKTVRTASASEGAVCHLQTIVMGSNYIKDAIPGRERCSVVGLLPSVGDVCVQFPVPQTHKRLSCNTDTLSTLEKINLYLNDMGVFEK